MASLNVEKILIGTPDKAFLAARKELEADYNETSANEFFYTYCEQPLSFILRHSRDIFSETYFGYDFYLDLIDHNIYDPRVYEMEAAKVRAYIELAKEKNIPKTQIEKYELLLERLIQYASANTNFIKCMTIAASSDGAEEFFKEVFDYMYFIELSKRMQHSVKLDTPDSIVEATDTLAEVIFGIQNVYCKMIAGLMFCYKNPSYCPNLIEATRSYTSDISVNDDLGNVQRLEDCISMLMKDEPIKHILYKISGPVGGLLDYWTTFAGDNKNIAMCIAKKETTEGIENLQSRYEISSPFSSDGNSVFDVEESVEDESFQEALLCEKYDSYSRLQSIYEAKAESASVEGELISESAFDLLCGVESELAYMEWEDDGSPNAVIAKHIMTSKEKEEIAKEKERRSIQNSLVLNNKARENAVASESDLCNQIKSEIEKVATIDSATSDEDIKAILKEARSNLERFKKQASDSDFNRAMDLCNDLSEEIKVSDPMYESVDNPVDKRLEMFLESDSLKDDLSAESKDSEKPKKPNPDLATKIQNKALDHAAKDEERLAKNKEKTQKLKNAANALASTPKRVADDAKKMVADFDKWDDNRRKEFLLKPGYRHKIIRVLKNALIAGSVASANMALIPLLALCKHCSKLKDKRIRNELAKELENEIRICEEKINDANSAGDNKSKYELMRIKDKLEAEKIRVRVNSNYM